MILLKIGIIASALMVLYLQQISWGQTLICCNGKVYFATTADNQITELATTLWVPEEPAAFGTLFLWPGLQPDRDGANFLPIDNGVLQSVLTWGPSCTKGNQPKEYSTWWISAQYVNTEGSHKGYTGCNGEPIMLVQPGDKLSIKMHLSGSTWTQTISNSRNGSSVAYSIDMLNQAQIYANFRIEPGREGASTVNDVVFTETKITFQNPDLSNCELKQRGPDDKVVKPVVIRKGKQCLIQEIILNHHFTEQPQWCVRRIKVKYANQLSI